MTSPWIPTWLGVAWTTVFATILIVHLWHVIVLTGRERLWHCVHVLMAAGMIVMFAPTDRMIVSNGVGAVIFAAAAAITACLLVRQRAHRHNIGKLWLAIVIDLAAMVYMFVTMSTRLLWLTILVAGWFVVQAAGWSTGRLYAAFAHGGLGGPSPVLAPAPAQIPVSAATAPVAPTAAHDQPHHAHQDNAAHRTVIRATLTLMSVGMAYMLIAMQFGIATMPDGPGVPSMPGMPGM
jgi:hypothetical protein